MTPGVEYFCQRHIYNKMEEKKSAYWKFAIAFLAIVVFVVGGLAARNLYSKWQTDEKARHAMEAFDKALKDEYNREMADTYGGKTPQETLRLYIDAVEKGDYELASKYFVIEKREQWKNNLTKISKENKIDLFLTPIIQAQKSNGEYSASGSTFSIHDPILVSFIKYPNGIWKIIEI
jgi:hypothetical protein